MNLEISTEPSTTEFVTDLIAELRRQAALRNATIPCVLLKDLLPLCDEFERVQRSRDFYKRRCEALQDVQSTMRDPERKAVCDILANGSTDELTNGLPIHPHEQMRKALQKMVDMIDFHYRDGHIPENETTVPLEEARAALAAQEL